jgi:predicted DNA-binding protein YlxM (UPF0122 family)
MDADNNDHLNTNLWEVLDYSLEDDYSVSEILSDEAVTPKAIQRIIQTGNIGYTMFEACSHDLAQIKDIIDVLYKMDNPNINPSEDEIDIFVSIVHNMLYTKREQLNAYMQEAHNFDIKDMTATQIQEILNLEYYISRN